MLSRRSFIPRALAALTLLAALPALSVAQPGDRTFVAMLTPRQVVPVAASGGVGCVRFVLSPSGDVTFHLVVAGLTSTETIAAIHGPALPGVGGPAIHFFSLGNLKTGVWTPSAAQRADLLAGRLYVDIHTSTWPDGELRGQIVSALAELDGAQEVPPVVTAARGWAVFNVDVTTNTLSYHITASGVSSAETAAHIHGPAAHGAAAPPVFTLPPGNPKVGSWVYPQAWERDLCQGLFYVNIHTANNGNGEIRGQILGNVMPIDPGQEVPPILTSGGAGCALISIDPDTNTLGYDIRSAGLSSAESDAHIHGFAPVGVGGAGVLEPLPAGARKLGQWVYDNAEEAGILGDMTYINIHSAMHAGGEIRGQINFAPWPCPGDIDNNGITEVADIFFFLAQWFAMTPLGDFNGSGTADVPDIFDFLAAWFAPCP